MATLIKGNNGYNSPSYKEIQLDSTSENTSQEVLSEIAAFDAMYPCAAGSEAYSFDYSVYYKKKNNGTWASIL